MNDISILDMQRIAAGKRIKEKKYWLNALAGDITKTGFPNDYQVLNSNERTFETITCTLAQENFLLLSKLSGDSDIRLHIVLTAGLVALLHKYTGSTDIILGMPIYRQDVKGEYINKALVLRNRFYETATSRELLNVVRTTIVEAVDHQDYPIEILAEELIPSAGDGDFPLFDCVIMLENIHDKSYIQNIPLDMIFSFVRDNGHIGLTLAYNPLRYKKETVQLITIYLERLFSAALANLALPLPELEILTKEEKENLIFAFNNTAVEFPAAKTIAELFAEQVKLHSNRPAVSSNLDLSSFFADFEPGKIDLSLRQKFENCCFKKNPYVFKFKGSAFLEAIGIFTGTENKELTVLRTHKLNYIAVNKAVLSLMDCFDGKANIRSIFHEIAKSEDLRFLLYTIRKEKEEAGFTPGSIERMVIGKNFAQMVLLVKALLRAHLIDLAGCNPVDMEVIMPLPVEGGEEAQARNVENENPNGYRSGGTIKSPVLLLGDRTGPASTGLLYIASFLRRNGIEAYCQWNDIQVDNESLKANINKLLAEIRPQIVGVSMKWFPHIARVLEICRLVKEFDPGITIAVGGNTASYYKEKIIQFDCVDFVIVGDGEEPFLKLCLGETPVPNCVYKEGETIIETPQSYVQNESNSSDIYFSHLDQVFVSSPDPYLASDFFICTGKGCSMQCFYCGGCRDTQEKTFNRAKPFMRGAQEVRKDIIAAAAYTSIFWFDFDLPAYQSLDYYKNIWEGLDLSEYFCEFYFWKLPTFEFLDYVVKTFKYNYINIDLCSLSEPHRLKLSSQGLVKPQPTDEELFAFFDRCRKYDNIEIIVNQITGLPYFTKEDITYSHETLSKLLSRYSNIAAMDWGRLHAQPGAPIVDTYKQFNMHCYATTFEDFLHYSRLNMKEDIYPVLLTFNYPYIYSNDDELNSKISKFYVDSTRQITKYKEENEKNLSVVFDLSYSQLDERSDRLARLLRSKGVGDGVVVGVMVKRSMEMIVTMLAISKAGGAYLPIDYNYPAKRITYMLTDSKAAFLLVDDVFTGECAEIPFAGEVIDINDEFSYLYSYTYSYISLPVENKDKRERGLDSKSLAYIIYTSGSTGKPKGVMVEHCNVARLVKQCNYMDLDPGKRLLLTGNYVFDITTFEIWGSLLNGLNLFLADQEVILDGEKLKKFLWKNQVNILHLVPQVFNLLASAPGGYEIFSGLEYFLVGGDLVSPRYINELRIHNGQLKILHMYGPTENTTFSTFFPVEKEYKNTIPLGKPIGNSTVYILNKNNRVQPIGIPGEICVGGAGITRGYLNNPELTAEKFSTFLKESDAIPSVTKNRLYRTGDLGKWNREGNIEFLGREDHQVKIRGFRIELGEIETQLLKHESVKEALVLHREKGSGASGEDNQDIFLCAYIVLRDAGTPDRRTLRPVLKEYLAQGLPDYMIPDFVFLDKFPLTHNGKLDKRALPDPELIPGEEYIAPRDIIEEKLVAIWSDVLDRNSPGSVKIGIDDNFFDLGGHSLKATILASKIHKVFDVKIQLVEIFKMPKIRELANYIKEKNKEIFVSIEPAEKKEYYLLSSAQKRLYVLQRMNPEIISYNIPEIIPLPVESDLQKIEATFRKLIKRHESLRTSFHMINDTPVQVVHDHVAFKADLFDLKDTQNPRDYITRFISPFDLTQAPLIRTGLLKEAGKRCILIVDMHHVISDGSSHEILLNDFLSLYQGKDLPPLPVQYKDFSEWQNGEKETENLKRQEEYWLKEFAGEIPVLELPIDFPRPVEQSFEGNIVEFEISAEETRALNTMAITGGATLFMVLVAVLNVLLAKLSNQEDIVIGTPIAGRRHADLEKIIGMFVNTLALRNYPSGEITFAELVEDVAGRMLMVYENQEYPFEELVEKLSVRRDIGRNPLFDIMFGLQNINTGHTNRDKNPPIEVSPSNQPGFSKEKEYENLFQAVKFDLELYALEKGHRLSVSLHYCTKLFKKETVERFIIYFKKIVSIAVKYPGIRISQIEIIPAEEKKRLLDEFNDTRADFPTHKTIQQLVEEQAKIVPDRIALVGPFLTGLDIRLSYRELDELSHLMAHLLKKMGVNAEAIVGLMLERSIEMVIGIIGVWKAGGVYLPIDPQYPPERIDYILKDSGTKIVLTAEVIANILSTGNRHLATGSLRRNFPLSTDLAYIIYTSGSTGKPKGAMLEHIGMINHIWAKINDLQISKNSIVAQNASHTFDISVWQFFAALLQGGTTVIYANEVVLNPNTFISRLINDKISILEVVPSYLSLILNLLREKNFSLLHLEYLLVTGEEVKRYLVKQWFELYPGIRMVNAYGPTEASDDITHHIMDGVPHLERVPIGKPVQNMNIYIVDRNMQLCPLGVKGEIWVSGIGVGRGYLNDWGKTSRVFMTDPFSKNEGVRLYKTGDIGRRLPDGAIEFFGRTDYQVKIRGFRIEIGEIENHILNHPGIKEVVVIDREEDNGNKYLSAYIVSDKEYEARELREHLAKDLPAYMIPSFFVQMETLPLTPNGKIDRKALPKPDGISLKEDIGHQLPTTAVEKTLVEIWEKVLGRKNIGINENFFMIGGDSIKSIQIIARMGSAGYKIDMKDLFQYPVIVDLAPRVKKLKRIPDQFAITGTIPLTPIQADFFHKSHFEPHHYNQAVMLYSQGFDKEALNIVFSKITAHHDTLRLTFKRNPRSGEIVQFNHDLNYPFSMAEFDLKNIENSIEELHEKVNQVQASIDLETGPLMKLALFHLDDGDRLLIVIHHLVIDGISWRILFEDIETLYGQYDRGEKLVLPPKTDSYKRWAEQLTQYANSKNFLKEKSYWQKIASGEVPSIPGDFPIAENLNKDFTGTSFTLNEKETERLLTKANEAFGTEIIDLLLTAFGMAMKKTFDRDRIAITLEGHGREQILADIDISRTVGWFTAEYPVLFDISYPGEPGRQVKEIKETLRRIPNKGTGFGILKYLTAEANKNEIEFKVNPQIIFNYLGQFDADINQKSFFEIAKESPGNSQGPNGKREYILDVSGMTANKCLVMSISYNKTHFNRETMIELIGKFESELIHLIAFCCAKENRELTPSDFTYKELPVETVDSLVNVYTGIDDIYTLTPMQQGILFHSLVDKSSFSYFEQVSYRLHGNLDISITEKSLNDLFKRHDILRTAFVSNDIERPVQIVLRDRTVDFYYEDMSHLEKIEEKEILISEFKYKDKIRSFDLSKNVLMRVAILRIADFVYEFTWSFHHILMDGWCIGILNNEFFEIYRSYIENRTNRLPGVKPYRTYIQWLERQDNEGAARYWENYLDSFAEQTGVPAFRATRSKDGNTYRNETVSVVLDMDKTAALKKLAAGNQVTLNTLTQTMWGILLGKYNEKEDVVFGAVVSGRPSELDGVESMVGLFINTIPVRIHFGEDMNFYRLLQIVQEEALLSEPYHYHPLAEIQATAVLKQNLIDHIMVFENYPITEQIEGSGREKNKNNEIVLQLANIEVFEQTNYNFNIVLGGAERLSIKFQYNGNVYDRYFVERMAAHFSLIVDQVVDQVIANLELKINQLILLSEEEKNRILYEFNNTEAAYPQTKTIHRLFEEQAGQNPDSIAVIGKRSMAEEFRDNVYTQVAKNFDIRITYKELNDKANRLASRLIEKGVQPDFIVGIMVERSLEMIIGILGILKAGGVYLPIDPEYPKERSDFMLKDSGAKILLTGEDLAAGLVMNGKASPIQTHSHHAAYIIYTSGTTGRPKGVIIQHSNVVRLFFNSHCLYDFNRGDVWTMFHSYCFDFSVWEMYGALLFGGKSVIIPKIVSQDPAAFINVLQKQRVTILNQTPSAFYSLIDEELKHIRPALNLRYIIFGGEALTPIKLKEWRQRYPGTRLINMFGITETTVHVTYKEITEKEIDINISCIGSPIPTLSTYLFDPGLKLSPIGIPGELCVGGEGVARGYLNRPELTYQKFIENPFKKGEKLYKSGDLVRLSYDGEMEYLGRIDQQIQVRGFRVELGEIESRLLKFPGIKETVVLALEEKGDKYLCAYIVSDREYGRSELRKHLSNELPDYMMPAYFVRLEKIPLTPSGKVDRRALPVPYLKAGESYTAPGNEIETKLVELWAGILGRDELHASQLQTSIGIDDNFFELGGHSLKVTILVSRIHKVFDVKVPLTEIFKRPKIRELANYIKEKRKEYYISIEPVEKQEYYRLSSAQKRLYILQQIGLNGIAYNLPEIIPLPAASDWKKIAETFKKLIQRHEGLRTSFHMIDDTPVQVIHDRVEFGIGLLDSNRSHDSQGNIKQFIRPFDLSIAPLIRVGLINEEDKRRFLIIDMHHIISDGVSHQVLVKDFFSIYNEETIPPLRVQYKDFAEWQNGENEAENLIRQESYWLKEFAGEIPALELPTDFPRPEAQSFEGDIVDFAISAEETRALDAMALNGGATLFMVLVAVVNILFSKLSSQEDIVIGTPIAGRRHADLDKIIGMFVNTLSLRNNPTGDRTFRDFLGEVKEKTLAAFENQEYPFEELVDKLSVKRDMGRNPLFDVMFALQNMNTGLADRDKEAGFETHRPDPFDSLKEYGSIFQSSKFDLTLNVIEKGAVLFLSFEYCTKLFKKETVERFIIYFKKIVSTVVTNPLVRISEIGIITEEEKKRILHDFNETNVEYPRDKTIHLLFEEQVKRTPDYIALIDSYLQVSYRELDKKSGVLAHVLQSKGTGSDTIVGIMMERSVEMIAAILGILKSGGAYLPIDPDYPLERVNYMLRDSAAGILINKSPFEAQSTKFETNSNETNPNDPNKNRNFGIPFVLNFETLNFEFDSCCECRASDLVPSNLAYVIYTSGSTGNPKGVLVAHRNVIRLVNNTDYIQFKDRDRILQTGALSFDASTFEIWGALLNGMSLVLFPKEQILNPVALKHILRQLDISTIWMTAPLFNQMADEDEEIFARLRNLLVGGDILSPVHINRVRKKNPGLKIINGYGPTENTTFSTTYSIESDYDRNIPIGRPISNSTAYILDKNMNVQPIGVWGELYVGGDGVSRGYLNCPELTAEKYIRTANTLYRTGDLSRWLPDGNIEFIGRIDHQVKIRGFRIEPGEIESRLMKYKEIKEAVVTAASYENGNRYLCAYISASRDFQVSGLRRYLEGRIPGYMIPSKFVLLEEFPLTNNGKIDREKLNSLGKKLNTGGEYVAPKSDNQIAIAEAWKKILELDQVGIYDNFFDLGGTSLDMIRLNHKLKEIFKRDIPIIAMYRYTTVDSFSHFLGDGNTGVEDSPISPRYKEHVDKMKKGIAGKNKRREIASEIRSRRRK